MAHGSLELVISQITYDAGSDEYRVLATEPMEQNWHWRQIPAEAAGEIYAELRASLERPHRHVEEDGLAIRKAPAILKRLS